MALFMRRTKQFFQEEKNGEEDHSEPQNKVLATDEGGQLTQNEEAKGQNAEAQGDEAYNDDIHPSKGVECNTSDKSHPNERNARLCRYETVQLMMT